MSYFSLRKYHILHQHILFNVMYFALVGCYLITALEGKSTLLASPLDHTLQENVSFQNETALFPSAVTMEYWQSLHHADFEKKSASPDWRAECRETWGSGSAKTVYMVDPCTGWPAKKLSYYEDSGQLFEEADLYCPSTTTHEADVALKEVIDGIHIIYYETGMPHSISSYKIGKLHGVQKRFFENGSLELKRTYIEGKIEKKEILYWPVETQFKSIKYNIHYGQVRREANYENGLLQGSCITYSTHGEKETEESFRKGVLHGRRVSTMHENAYPNPIIEHTTWYNGLLHNFQKSPARIKICKKTGKIVEEQYFQMGVAHGSHIQYRAENNSIQVKENYVFGKRQGRQTFFDKDGNIIGQGLYKNGQPCGTHTYCSSFEGPLIEKREYTSDGRAICTTYYQQAPFSVKEVFSLFKEKLEGLYTSYYIDTQNPFNPKNISKSFEYKDDCFHGVQKEYYPSGIPIYEYLFFEGKRDGEQKEWAEDGSITAICQFKKGLRDGVYQDWFAYKPTQKGSEGSFSQGLLDGTFMQWHDNGVMRYSATWSQGIQKGLIQEWSNNAQKVLRCHYNEQGVLHGEYEEWYADGLKKTWANYQQGKQTGLFQEWYDKEQLARQGSYLDGKVDAEYSEWYPDGSLASQGSYCNGHPIGIHKKYYKKEDSQEETVPETKIQKIEKESSLLFLLAVHESYDDEGLYHGEQIALYPNRVIKTVSQYEHGKLQGSKKRYNSDGTLVFEATYFQNVLDGRYFQKFSNGMNEEREYKAGLPCGTWRTWVFEENGSSSSSNKIIRAQAKYLHGKLQGEYCEYYPNGKIALSVSFDNGLKNGPAIMYGPTGHIHISTHYKNGIEEGTTTLYYQSGQIYRQLTYKSAALHGCDTIYYKNGTIKIRRHFLDGVLDGLYQEWSEKKVLIFEGEYHHGKRHGIFKKYKEDETGVIELLYKDDMLLSKKK